jgi:hypothetical protein
MIRYAPLAAALLLALSASSVHATPDMLAVTNADRAAAGLTALIEDPALNAFAQARADDMETRDYFSHNIPPDGHLVFADMGGYCFLEAGENIGMWIGEPADVEALFMASPSHRANILGSWTEMGFGIATTADGSWIVDVLFAQPCGAAPTQCLVLATNPDGSLNAPCASPTQFIDVPASATPRPAPKATAAPHRTPPGTSTAVMGGAGLLVWGHR